MSVYVPPCELIDGTGLMSAGESEFVILTVLLDAVEVVRLEVLDGGLNGLHATLLTHSLGRKVAVKAGTVPIASNRLGMNRNLCAEFLSNSSQEEARNPKVVAHCLLVSHDIRKSGAVLTHSQCRRRDPLDTPTERA